MATDAKVLMPMNRLRINFVLPNASLAGGIKSNRLIGEAMQRRGHDVRLLYSTACNRNDWRSRVKWLLRSNHSYHHLKQSTATLVAVKQWPIRENEVPDADISIATWWETREWIEPWSARKGIKGYFVRHHEVHLQPREALRVAATYRLPGPKFAIARWLERLMREEYGQDEVILVPNGVDRTQFGPPPSGHFPEFVVGLMHSHHPLKGVPAAIEAIRRVQSEIHGLRVISYGADRLAKGEVLPSGFEHHQSPAQALIPVLYRQCRCWILPSVLEGFGMPGLEAAACGCPVVATRCGGAEDYVEDGVTGYLVPVGDVDAMAAAIRRILELSPDHWQTMSAAGMAGTRPFDWDRSAEILEAAIFAALHGRQPRLATA